ncbi:MAG: alpha/beta hydrolase family protein, partial [Candidatus Hydrogenedens sp.]
MKNIRSRGILLLLLVIIGNLSVADLFDENILQKANLPLKVQDMMREYLNTHAVAYLKSFEENPNRFPEKENIETYKNERRELYWSLLGGKPNSTPLNPVIVRKGTKSAYKYEVLYFESQPNFYVSAVLFLPLSQPPYPCVIVPCGHSQQAKGYSEYQKLCILLSKNGIASLIYDPPGQGERITFLKEDGSPDVWGTAEHTILGLGCILLGENYAQYEIWDGIRAIDYIETREEIQKDKIGCSGNSGGGTQTAYLMALEPRIYASAPSCYLTSWERLLNTIGPQDAEQNIFSQIKHGYDHSEYLFMHAPNPVLICSATKDFFDITGTWATFRLAKRLYAKLGVNHMCDLIEVDTQHGLGKSLRDEIVERMLLWLNGLTKEIEEQIDESELLTKEEYQVCNGGNIKEIPGSKTIIDINRDKAKVLAQKRDTTWASLTLEQKQSKVRELINVDSWENVSEPKVSQLEQIDAKSYPEAKSITSIVINPEGGIFLP